MRAPQNWLNRRGERAKQILLGSGMMTVSSLVNTIARVGMVALLTRIYAREEFGVWAAITSATAIMATSDFGIGNALRNKLAALAVQGETGDDEAREYFLSVFYFFLIAALLLSAGLLLVSQFIPFQMLFKTSDVVLQRAGADIFIAVQIIFFIGIPLGIGPTMFFAYQESVWGAVFSLLYGLIGAVMVCGLALTGQSIVTTAIWYFLVGLLVTMVGTAVFLHRRRWNPLRVTPRLILPRVWSLLSLSLRFGALQVTSAFIFNAATLVTSATIGVVNAAEYNLAQKLYTFVVGLYVSLYNPLWAGYADAVNRGEWLWCQRTLKRMVVLTALVFGGITLIFTFSGNWFLQLLAGKGYVGQPLLFFFLGIWAWSYCSFTSAMAFQSALGRINLMTSLTLLAAILFIPLSNCLGRLFGLNGIALTSALIFSFLALASTMEGFAIITKEQSR